MNKSETILKDLGVWNPKTVMKWYKKKAFLYKKNGRLPSRIVYAGIR